MRTLLPLPFLLLSACPDGREVDEGPHCEATRTPLQLDEVSPIGVVAADVLARVPSAEDTELTYEDGSTTTLSLAFTPAATAEFVDLEAVYPEGGVTTDIAVICDDYVAIESDFTMKTLDGLFDEALSGEIQASAEALPSLRVELDLANLGGTFDIADFTDVSDYDQARTFVSVQLGDEGTNGAIEGDVSGEDECSGDDCAAWDVSVPVGTWGETVE